MNMNNPNISDEELAKKVQEVHDRRVLEFGADF
jgi:hypothetical protein